MATISDNNPLIVWLKQSKNEDELYKKYSENNISYMLVNLPEAARLASYEILNFDEVSIGIFHKFWNKYVIEVHKSIADLSVYEKGFYSMKKQLPAEWQRYSADPRRYVYVYKVLTPEESSSKHPVPQNYFLERVLYTESTWNKIQKGIYGKKLD